MNYLFDFFDTIIEFDQGEYQKLMSESFGLEPEGYKNKIRIFIDARDFGSKEDALDNLLNYLNIQFTRYQRESFFRDLDTLKSNAKIREEVIETLQILKKKGNRLAILSNANNFVDDLLYKNLPTNLLDFVLLSHKEGLRKPNPRFYELACQGFEARPSEIIMIGDSLKNDVLTPINLGMQGILFDPKKRNPKYSGKRIEDFRELLKT